VPRREPPGKRRVTSNWSLVADGLLSLLLIGAIVAAVRLEAALRVIRRDRGVFEALIVNLSSATESVQAGIQALRNEADRAAGHIGQSSQEADKMATDLSFLIDAADRAGARLEERLRSLPSGPATPIPESKSVRIARKLRAGVLIPMPLHSSVPPGISASSFTPAAVLPASAGKDPRSGRLFERAGITTRRRPPDAGEAPGTADASGMPATVSAVDSAMRTG